jgi:hypothetical protein
VNLYSYAGNNPVAYADPFGLCPIEKDGVPCKIYVTAYGTAHGASLSGLQVGARHELYNLAQRSGHDLGVNATTNGTHTDPRHNGVDADDHSRDNPKLAGLAVDVGEVDHRRVGSTVGADRSVESTALHSPNVKAVIDPNGYWNSSTPGATKHAVNDPGTVREHRLHPHFHIDIW